MCCGSMGGPRARQMSMLPWSLSPGYPHMRGACLLGLGSSEWTMGAFGMRKEPVTRPACQGRSLPPKNRCAGDGLLRRADGS